MHEKKAAHALRIYCNIQRTQWFLTYSVLMTKTTTKILRGS